MRQRCISLLLLFGFVASQLATIPHVHAWTSPEEQQKHDSTPHIHFDWLRGSKHRHEHVQGVHTHAHGGRSHTHASRTHSHSLPGAGQAELTPVHDAGDHEASMIAVPDLTGLPACGSHSTSGQTISQLAVVTDLFLWQLDLPRNLMLCWHPPDPAWAESHLYISLRNLRL